ncbi:hypothetical protein BG011_009600 [Mortierella polycephala]|uniref:Uncharacterized protein n=1 Tax=Mortierella polycephala TaxID=41804 RepID=A0A9P6TWE5_9FUNG|nr:hypothetical protein BG011_009600 [Mortierella polycephala]
MVDRNDSDTEQYCLVDMSGNPDTGPSNVETTGTTQQAVRPLTYRCLSAMDSRDNRQGDNCLQESAIAANVSCSIDSRAGQGHDAIAGASSLGLHTEDFSESHGYVRWFFASDPENNKVVKVDEGEELTILGFKTSAE